MIFNSGLDIVLVVALPICADWKELVKSNLKS